MDRRADRAPARYEASAGALEGRQACVRHARRYGLVCQHDPARHKRVQDRKDIHHNFAETQCASSSLTSMNGVLARSTGPSKKYNQFQCDYIILCCFTTCEHFPVYKLAPESPMIILSPKSSKHLKTHLQVDTLRSLATLSQPSAPR